MSFPRYDSYRDSGIATFGDLPSHWKVNRLKHVLSQMGSGGTPETDNADYWSEGCQGIPWVAIGDMSERDLLTETNKRLSPEGIESKGLLVWPSGTLLFSMYASLGHVCETAIPAAINQAILAMVPAPMINQGYLKRWFQFLRPQLKQQASSNTQDNLNAAKVADLTVVVPPLDEQVAIAAFLDRETAKIDALVEAQRQLIELLKEKRQAVISHAVTKGLDPNVPMKDSGVEWLGEVPAHWEVVQAGRIILQIEQGWSPSADEREPDEGEPSVLRLSAVKDGEFVAHKRKALPNLDDAELQTAPMVREGDFLLTRANTPDLVGDCAIASRVPGTIFSDLIYRLSFDTSRANSRFLLYAFRSRHVRAQIKRDARGSSMSMAKISHSHIKGLWLALPPLREQEAIASEIAFWVRRLDDGTRAAEAVVSLLLERRAALISAAVTGTIDVRGAVSEQAEAA